MNGGGGLTWAAWLAVGVGSLLVYAGMTGQSLVAEVSAVLNNKALAGAAPGQVAPIGSVQRQQMGAAATAPAMGSVQRQQMGGAALTTPSPWDANAVQP